MARISIEQLEKIRQDFPEFTGKNWGDYRIFINKRKQKTYHKKITTEQEKDAIRHIYEYVREYRERVKAYEGECPVDCTYILTMIINEICKYL